MENIKKQKAVLKGKITRIKNLTSPKIADETITFEELEMYYGQIQDITSELNKVHENAVLQGDSTETEAMIEEYNEIALKLDTLTIAINTSRNKLTKRLDIHDGEIENYNKTKSNVFEGTVKLPKFELKPFYGEVDQWLSFKEIFISTIDKNSELGNVSKLQYLLASVKGPAHKLISGFPLSEVHYKNAWDTLCTRYDKTRDLAMAQISKLYNLKNMKNCSSSAKAIFDIIDTCNESLRILDSLKLTKNTLVENMIIYAIIQKLNDNLKERWELSLTHNDMPSLAEFLNFLEAQAKSLLALENPTKTDARNQSYSKYSSDRLKFPKSEESNKCGVCPESHATHTCRKLMSMPVDSRWRTIQLNKLCVNCMRGGHFASKCPSKMSCKNCHRRHHTLLHKYDMQGNAGITMNPNLSTHNNENQPQNTHVYSPDHGIHMNTI